ncbi:MAG: ribonuclease HI family protein [bacterium]
MPKVKKSLHLFCDGACRGNPGPAGIGGVVKDVSGENLLKFSESIGVATNNIAEYKALIFGLMSIEKISGEKEVKVFSDSELMVKQLNGYYKVKEPTLLLLLQEVIRLKNKFKKFEISHISRSKNKEADFLANQSFKDKNNGVQDLF